MEERGDTAAIAGTPDYTIGCKRILLSSNYYRALQRPNVDLITSHITEITANSVITAAGTAEGTAHQAETIEVREPPCGTRTRVCSGGCGAPVRLHAPLTPCAAYTVRRLHHAPLARATAAAVI